MRGLWFGFAVALVPGFARAADVPGNFSMADPDLPLSGYVMSINCQLLRGNPDALLSRLAPADAVRGHDGQVTVLQVNLRPDGRVAEASILKHSAHTALDERAVACAKYLDFVPRGYGVAIAPVQSWTLLWVAAEDSRQAGTFPMPVVTPPLAAGAKLTCGPDPDLEGGISGQASVTFSVGADGKVSGAAIQKRSGMAAMDAATLSCVQQWAYAPATLDGAPVALNWSSVVSWDGATKTASSATAPMPMQMVGLGRCASESTTHPNGTAALAMTREGAVGSLTIGDKSEIPSKVADCLKQLRYLPPTRNGAPVEWTIKLEFDRAAGVVRSGMAE